MGDDRQETDKVTYEGWCVAPEDDGEFISFYPVQTTKDRGFISYLFASKDYGLLLDIFDSISSSGVMIKEDIAMTEYFSDPLSPTPEERSLFEIEFGFPYPEDKDLQKVKEWL